MKKIVIGLLVVAILVIIAGVGGLYYIKPDKKLDLAYENIPMKDRAYDMLKNLTTELTLTEKDVINLAKKSLAENPRVEKDPTQVAESDYKVMVGAGWKPGWSTDYCAVMAAKKLGAKKLVNLSNIDYVCDSDPRKNPDAKKIEKINWAEFRKLIPEEWNPGLSSPFDPVAATEAEALGLEVAIMNGANLEEFSNYLEDKPFLGTIIS